MNHEKDLPYICHVFICTNDRKGARQSCEDGRNSDLKAALKQEIKQRGWNRHVRVSSSGCLGLCDVGPNVVIYPHRIWLSAASPDDVGEILAEVERIVGDKVDKIPR
ncbi:MAG: (2Fe-2S) ferredoxin domain-containing protein [Planctomycetota bacterium]|jgi:(2Fe-2S) ferredoxin